MPFSTPTITDLVTRAQTDIKTRLPGADASLANSVLGVLAQIQAHGSFGLHQHLNWLSKQILPDTAEAEIVERWAALFNVVPNLGTRASGVVTFSGTEGSSIAAGTLLQSEQSVMYKTDATATIADATALVAVTAVSVGVAGNQAADTKLTLTRSLTGVDSETVTGTGLSGGADPETIERLRIRLLARLRESPHGGAAHDYINWALAAHPDVTRAWVYPLEGGPGKVVVRFMTDSLPTAIPDPAIVARVQAYIDTRRPVAASVSVLAPISASFDIAFERLEPDSQQTRDAIEAEIRDLMTRIGPGDTLLLSQIRQAVSIGAGDSDYAMTAPNANVTHNIGEIATLGTIHWTASP